MTESGNDKKGVRQPQLSIYVLHGKSRTNHNNISGLPAFLSRSWPSRHSSPHFLVLFFCLRGGGRSSSTYVTHMEWFSRGPALDSRQICVRAADVNGRVTLCTTPRFPEGSILLVLPLVVCWPDSTADKGKDMKECDSHSLHFMSWLWSKQNKF